MERSEILNRMQGVVRTVFKNDSLQIEEDTEIQLIESWDSLLHMQLIVALEKEFGIKFKLAELNRLTGVSSIIDVISSKFE